MHVYGFTSAHISRSGSFETNASLSRQKYMAGCQHGGCHGDLWACAVDARRLSSSAQRLSITRARPRNVSSAKIKFCHVILARNDGVMDALRLDAGCPARPYRLRGWSIKQEATEFHNLTTSSNMDRSSAFLPAKVQHTQRKFCKCSDHSMGVLQSGPGGHSAGVATRKQFSNEQFSRSDARQADRRQSDTATVS